MSVGLGKHLLTPFLCICIHICPFNSFVAHSLGGLVVRVALKCPELQPYLSKLHTFLSLSVPHIGHSSSSTQLIPSAMWIWQKWTNSQCLKQIRLLDHADPYKTFLYKLSLEKGTNYVNLPCLARMIMLVLFDLLLTR